MGKKTQLMLKAREKRLAAFFEKERKDAGVFNERNVRTAKAFSSKISAAEVKALEYANVNYGRVRKAPREKGLYEHVKFKTAFIPPKKK